MPSKKIRGGGEGKNERAFPLQEAMHIPNKRAGTFGRTGHVAIEKVNDNMRRGASPGGNKSRSKAIETKAGYDVATRVNVPTAKEAGKRARTQKNMKSKA